MAIKELSPYLFFDGKAADAIALYERVLGAKLDGPVMRFADAPGMNMPSESGDKVMHASLKAGTFAFMLSDCMPGTPRVVGDQNVHLSLAFDTLEHMQKTFDGLAEGGNVTMAIHDAFWGGKFGTLVDAFGIHWMFSCENAR